MVARADLDQIQTLVLEADHLTHAIDMLAKGAHITNVIIAESGAPQRAAPPGQQNVGGFSVQALDIPDAVLAGFTKALKDRLASINSQLKKLGIT